MTSPHKRKAGKQGLRGRGNRVPRSTYDGIMLSGAVDPADMVDKASRRIAAAAQTRAHQAEIDRLAAQGSVTTGPGRPKLVFVKAPEPAPLVVCDALVRHMSTIPWGGGPTKPKPKPSQWTLKDARSLLEQGYRPERVAYLCKVDEEVIWEFMDGIPYDNQDAEIVSRAPVQVHHGTVDGYWWHRSIKKNKTCDACKAAYAAENDLPVPPAPTVYKDPSQDDACGEKKGTIAGRSRHRRRKQKVCEACAKAWSDYNKPEAIAARKAQRTVPEAPPAPPSGRNACTKRGGTGTAEGYLAHVKRKERACDPCKAAWKAESERTA